MSINPDEVLIELKIVLTRDGLVSRSKFVDPELSNNMAGVLELGMRDLTDSWLLAERQHFINQKLKDVADGVVEPT